MPWTPRQTDPLAGYHFAIEIDGVPEATFRECTAITSESQIIESKEAGPNGRLIVKKVPGAVKWADVTLKRSFTVDDSLKTKLRDWRKDVEDGKVANARKNVSLVMYDQSDTEKVRYNLINAWPSKLTGPVLNATGNDVATEEVTFCVEGVVRVL